MHGSMRRDDATQVVDAVKQYLLLLLGGHVAELADERRATRRRPAEPQRPDDGEVARAAAFRAPTLV